MARNKLYPWQCSSCGWVNHKYLRYKRPKCDNCNTTEGVVRNAAIVNDPKFRFGPHHNNLP